MRNYINLSTSSWESISLPQVGMRQSQSGLGCAFNQRHTLATIGQRLEGISDEILVSRV